MPHIPFHRRATARAAGAALLLVAALAGCRDQIVEPGYVAPDGAPLRSVLGPDGRYDVVSVTRYQSKVTNGDWRLAIQTAVDSSHAVYFPAGTYTLKSAPLRVGIWCNRPNRITGCDGYIHGSIRLKSGTRVYGAGSTSIIEQTVDSAGVFMAWDTSETAVVDDLKVDSLTFFKKIPPPTAADNTGRKTREFALWTRRGTNVRFSWNRATNMGLYENDHYLEFRDSYSMVPSTGWSTNIQVTDNVGVGRRDSLGVSKGYPRSDGILIGWGNNVTIARNDVSHYRHGILWSGGGFDNLLPLSNPRKAKNYTITGNTVKKVEAGIWGGMGENITASQNTVEECADLCLDSEGGLNVTFEHNTAKYGVNGALGALYNERNLVFRWNQVYQNDQQRLDANGNPNQKSDLLMQVNISCNSASACYTSGTSFSVHNNRFEFQGTGYGAIMKNATETFRLVNNELINTVVRFQHGDQGGVEIQGNELSFTNGSVLPEAAIYVENNTGPMGAAAVPVNGGWELVIYSNRISSTTPQTTVPGIRVKQDVAEAEADQPVESWIAKNVVRDFTTSVQATRSSNDAITLQENGYSGTFPAGGTGFTLNQNYVVENQPHRIGYQVHGLDYATYQGERYGFETAGTTGESRDLDAFKVRLLGTGRATGICYQAYVAGTGWQSEACDNAQAGTVGQNKKLRAFKIRLDYPARIDDFYRWGVCYQAHVGNQGWGPEVCEGTTAGTTATTNTNAVQAIRVKVVPFYDPVPPEECPDPSQPICTE